HGLELARERGGLFILVDLILKGKIQTGEQRTADKAFACGVDLGILLLEGYKGNRQRRAGGQLPFFIGAARRCGGGSFVQGNSSLSSNYGSHHLMHRREYRCISTGRKRQGLRR